MDKRDSERLSRLNKEVHDLLRPVLEDAQPAKLILLLRVLVRGMRAAGCSEELVLKNVSLELEMVNERQRTSS